jgi:hypothetical protein
MERSNALLVLVIGVIFSGLEKFLHRANLAQPRQLHDILFNGKGRPSWSHLFQFYLSISTDWSPIGWAGG